MLSEELGQIIESRSFYLHKPDAAPIPVLADGGSHYVSCAMPIIADGDIIGCVLSGWPYEADASEKLSENVEAKLLQTAGVFLGKQMES